MNHLDVSAEKHLAQAISSLHQTIFVIAQGHPFAVELEDIIDKLENSQYMKWLAKTRFEEEFK